MPRTNALPAGESWTSHTIHVKGLDSFTTSEYAEGATRLIEGFEAHGVEVTFLRNHDAARDFPTTVEALTAYDAVLLSDIGSNTLLLPPDTFVRCEATPNRSDLLRDYVHGGGGLAMIGGYLSFSGIDGKALFQRTSAVDIPDHPVLRGIDGHWPHFLGYNRLHPTSGGDVIARVGDDVFLATGTLGRDRSAAAVGIDAGDLHGLLTRNAHAAIATFPDAPDDAGPGTKG